MMELYCNRYKKYVADLNKSEEKECVGTWRGCAECDFIDDRERITYCNLYGKNAEDVNEHDLEEHAGCSLYCGECRYAEEMNNDERK